jgi:hypothetical protein
MSRKRRSASDFEDEVSAAEIRQAYAPLAKLEKET